MVRTSGTASSSCARNALASAFSVSTFGPCLSSQARLFCCAYVPTLRSCASSSVSGRWWLSRKSSKTLPAASMSAVGETCLRKYGTMSFSALMAVSMGSMVLPACSGLRSSSRTALPRSPRRRSAFARPLSLMGMRSCRPVAIMRSRSALLTLRGGIFMARA